jgi:DNA polymerase-3 subunit delta'
VRRLFNALFTNNGIEISKFADDWSKKGREQEKNFLQYVIQLLEQTIRARYLPQIPPALPEEEQQFVRKLAANDIGFESLQQMMEDISKTIYHIERNAHGKTQLHALSIKLLHLIQGRELAVV